MRGIDSTHDPDLRSWVASANREGTDFPIQNLPFGVFSIGGESRGGIAIGDMILDLRRALDRDLFDGPARDAADLASRPALNDFMAAGPEASGILRRAVSTILDQRNDAADELAAIPGLLVRQSEATMELPCSIGDYTDFLTSLHHTERNGRLKGLAVPLPPASLWLPVAYHGRASSIVPSGTPVVRPHGQRLSPEKEVVFGPTLALDFELELAAWIGRGNSLGTPIRLSEAPDHIFGFSLLNDWSAKDVQWWEQVLGPFQGKSFASTISPWIVTEEALAPFRAPRDPRSGGQPQPLPHLDHPSDRKAGGLRLRFTARLGTVKARSAGRPPQVISSTAANAMHWTFGQMIAHHTANGCNLRPGDLLGSGTLSGEQESERACMTELTAAGASPLTMADGERRGWLEDGDEVQLTARADAPGFMSIGFGPCVGVIAPAARPEADD